MKPSEILIKARALIQKGWTQHAYARNEVGRDVFTDSKSAVCWCAEGAIIQAMNFWTVGIDSVNKYLKLFCRYPNGSIVSYNDDECRSQQDALDWFDWAIAVAVSEGQ